MTRLQTRIYGSPDEIASFDALRHFAPPVTMVAGAETAFPPVIGGSRYFARLARSGSSADAAHEG